MVKDKQQRTNNDSCNNRPVKMAFLCEVALRFGNSLVERVIARRIRARKIRNAHLKYSCQGAQCFQAGLIAILDTLHRAHTQPGQFGKSSEKLREKTLRQVREAGAYRRPARGDG